MRLMERWIWAVVVLVGGGLSTVVRSQDQIEILRLRPNFYVLAGGGANVGVQVGEDGVVLVDSGAGASSGGILAAIQKITPKPIRYIINTNGDPDHVGGNEALSKAGQTLLRSGGPLSTPNASILAAEQVLARVSAPTGESAALPAAGWPTETFGLRTFMYLNDEGIEILHLPAAHSDGDAVVFFRKSDVIVAGDILDMTRFPVLDVARGGSVQGELDALNRVIDMAIPSVPVVAREGGTIVVPGHGRIGNYYDVVHYRDMVHIVRDHVADMKKSGKTLDEVKTAAPAKGYAGRYGSDSGSWTTNHFIEAIYRSLK